MADKDFKVKNGLIVGDSATIGNSITVTGDATISGTTNITGNLNVTGSIVTAGITGAHSGFDSDFNAKSTSDLSEGSNLYHTTARVNAAATTLVDSAYITLRTPEYTRATIAQTMSNKTIVDPIIDSTGLFGQQYGGLSINRDENYGNSTQSVLTFISDDSTRAASVVLGVDEQFNHTIGVTGNNDLNDFVIGFNDNNTTLKIKASLGSQPYDLTGGTNLFTIDGAGKAAFSNAQNAVSKTNAAVTIAGGLGVDKDIRGEQIVAAGNILANGTLTGDLTATSLSNRSTTDLSEGTNLYYTDVRVDSYINASIFTTDVSEGTNLYYTTSRADSDAKNAISVNDAGGEGSLTYTASTGVISFSGPSAADIRGKFSGGTGVTLDGNGVISIGQAVSTTDSIAFAGGSFSGNVNITGDLVVGGDYILQETNDLRVTNSLIKLADSNTANAVDIGVVGRYSTDGGSTIRRAGFFRDATNGEWYTFTNLIQDDLDSSPAASTINTGHSSFELGTWNFGALNGRYLGFDSDFTVFSTNFIEKTSNFTAVTAGRYAINTSGGQFTATLPANPTTGDYVKLIDVANLSAAGKSLLVGRNGSTIEGAAEDFDLDIGQNVIEFIFINNTWNVYAAIGQRGEKGDKGDSADVGNFATQNQSIAFSIALG
jgi:hypothetical protein